MQNKRKRIKVKLKKTIALAVIANILLSLFCLSAFADNNYPETLTLNEGDILVFNDTISPYYYNGPATVSIDLKFICPLYIESDYTYKKIQGETISYSMSLAYITNGNITIQAYRTSGNIWIGGDVYKTIEITETQTITDQEDIKWLYDNISSGLPNLPYTGYLENAKEFYSTSLNFGTILISFITANAITIIPIIFFVFIALLGCGIALIKRK